MWSKVNGNLPGVSLTTLTFSDGIVDYEPWKVGPKFALASRFIGVNGDKRDQFNRMYSSFIYLPESFRNDGACMIHEGASIPRRGKKCSLLIREFSVDGLFQYKVSCGNMRNMGYCICNKRKMSKPRNRSLTFQELRTQLHVVCWL